MNRAEMLKRLKKGEDPLELSIMKWQNIVDGKGRNYGSDNCALCETHKACAECIMPRERETYGACDFSPYMDYQCATSTKQRKEAAKKELKFLKSLRKGGKTKNDK